jgi:predicted ferric reductase
LKKYILAAGAGAFLAATIMLWWRSLYPGLPFSSRINDVGRLMGITGFVILPLQMALGSRIKALDRNIGLDRLLLFHRTIGIIIAGVILVHPLMITISEQASGFAIPFGPTKGTGLIAISALFAAVGASLIIRRFFSRYETWVRMHRIALLALPLAFIHSFFFGSSPSRQPFIFLWLFIALIYVALIIHRSITRYLSYRSPYRISKIRKEAPLINTLVMSGKPLLHHPGQFAFLRLPATGAFEWHPFTISSSSRSHEVSFTIKAVGDFTSEIACLKEGEAAFLHGPFGNFVLPRNRDNPIVFLAGGIGITPFLSMLRWLADKREESRINLFWANKTREDIFAYGELEDFQKRISGLRVVHVLSRELNWNGEKGHINEDVIRRNVSEIEKALFLLCGPAAFMETVRAILKEMGIQKSRITWERFSLI